MPYKDKKFAKALLSTESNSIGKLKFDPEQIATEMNFTTCFREKNLNNIVAKLRNLGQRKTSFFTYRVSFLTFLTRKIKFR
jgi:hypothetical protein